MRIIDETGKRHGKVTVIGRSVSRSESGAAYWWCLCDCGRAFVRSGNEIRLHRDQNACIRCMIKSNPARLAGIAKAQQVRRNPNLPTLPIVGSRRYPNNAA